MVEPKPGFNALVGIDNYEIGKDNVTVKLTIDERHLNMIGLVHGGAISTLADYSMGIACFMAAKKPLVTVEYKISYLRSVRDGTLTAISNVSKLGEHLAFVECSIQDKNGVSVAKAMGTYMIVGKS